MILLTFLKALTIRDKMLRHVEGDLDGEGARVLCCIDDGNDTRADGDQRQGDLVQRTVEVAWRKEAREWEKTQAEVWNSLLHLGSLPGGDWGRAGGATRPKKRNTQTRSVPALLPSNPPEGAVQFRPWFMNLTPPVQDWPTRVKDYWAHSPAKPSQERPPPRWSTALSPPKGS